jgi:hypothetical protein
MVTGNTLVILPIETYKTKIQDFIQNNQFEKLNTNPTDQYQKIKQRIIQKKT